MTPQGKMAWKQLGAVAFLALALGVLIGHLLHTSFHRSVVKSFRETDAGYEYIAPLLFVSVDEEQAFPEYRPLKNALQSFADKKKHEGVVEDISLYFRNLNTSQWVAVNPEERFAPGSMFKVATLIAALETIQNKPSLLNLRVSIGGALEEAEMQSVYPPTDPILPGNSYTIEQLLQRMVQESDNVANFAISQFAGDKALQNVYEELEILPNEDVPGDSYTVQEYSRLYRTLYNSTYLSRPYSEYALNLLASTSFTQGIVSGVPSDVRVSHKFGVRVDTNAEGTTNELHDCGIVYHPKNPYFICVMTRGTNFTELENILADASAVVWEEVDALEASR